jgi:CHASE2 domain-containing sensor protein
MKKLLVLLIIILTAIAGCKNYNKYVKIDGGPDSLIVLFNIKNYNRSQLSYFIEEINKYNPSVIGLNFLLDGQKEPQSDSLLASAIGSSKRIILASIIHSDSIVQEPPSIFTQKAAITGTLSYLTDENDIVTSYTPLFENNDGQKVSFPSSLAFYYDASIGGKEFRHFRVNEQVDILYTKTLDQFIILDETNFSEKLIKDKIVIFGYLGPDSESLVETPMDVILKKDSKTYLTVITANIVLNLIKTEPKK